MVIPFINPATRPSPEIAWNKTLLNIACNRQITAIKESSTKVDSLCKDRLKVFSIHVGYSFD